MIESFILKIEEHLSEDTYKRLMQLVSPEKRARIMRFHHFEDAQRTLLGDVMIRKITTNMLGLHNDQIEFAVNEYNKPYLMNAPDFHFNLSHSGVYVICVVSDAPVGIDVETYKPIDLKIAERFFTMNERQFILSQRFTEQEKTFYNIWTKKEAYIKYKGKGLGIPLDSFNVLDPNLNAHFHCILSEDKCICNVCSGNIDRPIVIFLSIENLFKIF